MLLNFSSLVKKYHLNVRGVIHVGAHELEELDEYHKNKLTDDKILWIDADPNLVQKNPRIVHAAISDVDDQEVTLNISSNAGASSSLLELDTHKKYYPHISFVNSVKVKTKRLDSLIKDFSPYNMINIDIQGCELLALKGLGENIKKLDYLYMEVNEEHLYKGCALVGEIDEYVKQFGFHRVETKMTPYRYCDALYMKNNQQVSTMLIGGMGNQLYQLAIMYVYAKKHNRKMFMDKKHAYALHGLHLYDMEEVREKFPIGEMTYDYFSYTDAYYYEEIPEYKCDLLINGYWQDERYFMEYKEEIKDLFIKIFDKIQANQKIPHEYSLINKHHDNGQYSIEATVASDKEKVKTKNSAENSSNYELAVEVASKKANLIHVRRGDFLTFQGGKLLTVLDEDYYQKAAQFLDSSLPTIVVSEDIEWCRNNIKADYYIFKSVFEDFNLLRMCQGTFIRANSTFSWWASYLSPAKRIIYTLDPFVYPKFLYSQRYQMYAENSHDPKEVSFSQRTLGISVKTETEIVEHIVKYTNENKFADMCIYLHYLFENLNLYSFSQKDLVILYNSLIINAWYLKKYDLAKNAAEKIIAISREKLMQVNKQIKQNCTYPLKEAAYQKINFREVNIYALCQAEKKAEILLNLKKKGLSVNFAELIMTGENKIDYDRSYLNLLNKLKNMQIFKPSLILIDDLQISNDFQTEIKVHKVIDVIYLNLVRGGEKLKIHADLGETYQISNVFNSGAILYLSPTYLKKCCKYLKLVVEFGGERKKINNYLESRANVISFKKSYFLKSGADNILDLSKEV